MTHYPTTGRVRRWTVFGLIVLAVFPTVFAQRVDTVNGLSAKGPIEKFAAIAASPTLGREINFRETARQAEIAAQEAGIAAGPVDVPWGTAPRSSVPPGSTTPQRVPSAGPARFSSTPAAFSPSPSIDFAAALDSGFLPPDTNGAVGPNHLMVTLNGLVRIMNRTGGVISTATLNDFFTGMFQVFVYDPKVFYDSTAQRWVLVACADANRGSAAFLIAASTTADPTGNWRRLSFDADPGNQDWNDYPSVGFNKDWIAVSFNMFRINGNFTQTKLFVITKNELYANATAGSRIFVVNDVFTLAPAHTLDSALAPLYLLNTATGNSNGAGFLRLHQITGAPGSETLSPLGFISIANTWQSGAGDLAPQANSTARLNTGDDRMLSVVYRNGSLWAAHNAFLPSGVPTRASAQWWQINPANLSVQQFGRIDDSTGATHHTYPSLAVNARNDVLIGFSRFSGVTFASAAYAFRAGTDPLNTTQPAVVFKAGLSAYEKRDNAGRNRWGDYSSTVVDPANDNSFWTLQEYAVGANQWGTWWAQVAPPGSAATVSVAAVSPTAPEGSGSALFRFTRTGSAAAPLTVSIAITGSANSGADYTALSPSVLIPAGATTVDLPLSVINDTAVEPDETVTASIAAGPGYSAGIPASAIITIVDDDGVAIPTITIQATDSSAAEDGDTGSVTISRTGSTAAAVAVNVSVAGSATAGADYTAIVSPITIPAGVASGTIQVTPLEDAILEGSETVTFNIAPGTSYAIGTSSSATVTVLDNDASSSVSIIASDAEAAEGGGSGEFTVTRTGGTGGPLTVNLTAGGTATPSADYAVLPAAISIPDGAANVSFNVNAVDDTVVDPGETVVVSIAPGTGYTVGSPSAAMIGIPDNDAVVGNDNFADRAALPTLSTTGSNQNATKETGEPNHAGNPGGRSVWWTWTADFTGSVTFSTAGSNFDTVLAIYSGGAVNALTQVAADDDEGPASTSQATFNATAGASYHIAVDGYSGASGTISLSRSADPVTAATVTIGATDAMAKEGAVDTAVFTISRTGTTNAALTVSLGVSGTAVNGGDYTGVTNSVTIAAGAAAATILINSLDDAMVEQAETVILTVSPGAGYIVGNPASATASINDNDQDTGNDLFADRIAFTEQVTTGSNFNASKEAGEPNHGDGQGGRSVWWSWTASFSSPVTFSTEGSDFDTLLGVYTGTNVGALSLVAGNDDRGAELTSLAAFNAVAGVTYQIAVDGYGGAAGNIMLTRTGDPTIPPFVIIETTRPSAKEGTSDTGLFTVSRSGGTASVLTVQLNITGSAGNGADYTTVPGSMTFPASVSAATIEIVPINDSLVEGEETVTVSLVPGTGYAIESAYNTGRRSSASLTILDDDYAETSNDMFSNRALLIGSTFTASRSSSLATKEAGEPNHAGASGGRSLWWTWTAPASGNVTINTSTSNFDTLLAVYTGSALSNLTNVAANDDFSESLTSAVSFNAVAGTVYQIAVDGYGGAGGNVGLLGALDAALDVTVTVQASDASASEASRDPGVFIIGRSGSTGAPLGVSIMVSGSGTNGGDYEALPANVVIPAGESSVTVTLLPIDDAAPESGETVILALAAGAGYTVGAPNSASVTIADDDALATLSIQATDGTATEAPGNAAAFQITREGNTSAPLTANIMVSGSATNGTDYETIAAGVTLPAGSTSATIIVTPIEDSAAETAELVTINLAPGAGYTIGSASAATASIEDDDSTPFVAIVADDPNASEEGSEPGSVTVLRSGNMTDLLTVNLSFSGSATNGSDYAAAPGTVVIPAGAESAQFVITPIDDGSFESLETVDLTLLPGSGYAVGTPAAAQIKIVDDDSGTPLNDAFASATALIGTTFSVDGGNVGATKETGEPDHAGGEGGRSVWWSWTAPFAGAMSVRTAGSSFDTLLGIYTGSDVGSLAFVAGNDDAGGSLTSEAVFLATAGVTYFIAVDGYEGASGSISLSGALDSVLRPSNDDFSQALQILSTRRKAINFANSIAAGEEPGEPNHDGKTGGSSVWWTWTAPNSKTYVISTAGSSFDTVLALYSGSTVNTLTLLGSNDDAGKSSTSRIKFRAVRGQTYRIAVDGFDGASGNVILRLYRP